MPKTTTTVTHTPGPWEVERPLDAGDFAAIVAYSDGQPVVIAELDGVPPYSREEGFANAHLIAAAPDGYALAKRLLDYFPKGEIDPRLDCDIEIRKMARELIAKAEARNA